MGGLHHGHSQLIQAAKDSESNTPSVVLVSVFVNPLQFGPAEDFNDYPRDLDHDIELAAFSGANAIWIPEINQIFPKGTNSHFKIKVPKDLQAHLCGSLRPEHFDGVATVILRLLALVKPTTLFLGEKDWQQFVIVRHLINDLGLAVKLRGIATFRDADGLPYSTRNSYLNKSERNQALALPRALKKATTDFQLGKAIDIQKIRTFLEKEGLGVEYLEAVDPFLLKPISPTKKLCLLAAAVRCGKARLIDHTFLMNRKPIVAIDGPAGAGKSTVTRAFAKKLGLLYMDTGAMYRAVTWLIKQKGISLENSKSISELLKSIKLELTTSTSGEQNVLINSENVSDLIRSPEVTLLVSQVASQSVVREALTAQQKSMGVKGGIVAEGRDIGTTVFPEAELKVFLTASTTERAKRRTLDLKEQGFDIPNFEDIEAQIKERDRIDSTRKISPLVKAEDATELITDGMSIEEVIETLIDLFRMRIPEEIWPSPNQ